MKKLLLTITALLSASALLTAAEGLWMPPYLPKGTLDSMKRMGCGLQENELYSERTPSLKDQVLLFSSGATGIVLSQDGLVLVPAGSLAGHLPEGMERTAAATDADETPLPGLSAWRLISTENVTWRIWPKVEHVYNPEQRRQILDSLEVRLYQLKRLKRGTIAKLHAGEGGQFHLCIYRQYSDIRLCYLPDVWWRTLRSGREGHEARHSADFALVRLYDDRTDGGQQPARMPNNALLTEEGVESGDFVLTLGFPGPSHPYLPLATWQERSYTEPYARWKADSLCLDFDGRALAREMDSLGVLLANSRQEALPASKIATENAYMQWAANQADFESQLRYAGALAGVRNMHQQRKPLLFRMALLQTLLNHLPAARAVKATTLTGDGYLTDTEWKREFANADTAAWGRQLDRVTVWMAGRGDTLLLPAGFGGGRGTLSGSTLLDGKSMAKRFKKSTLTRMDGNDPLIHLIRYWEQRIAADSVECARLDSARRIYTAYYYEGLARFRPELAEHPDGNYSLRLSYGQVGGYTPGDGVQYTAVTTLEGIYERNLTEALPALLQPGTDEQRSTVCQFLADVDQTPASVGSAVYNDRGELTGMLTGPAENAGQAPYAYEAGRTRSRILDIRYIAFLLRGDPQAERFVEELTWNEGDDNISLQYVAAPVSGTLTDDADHEENDAEAAPLPDEDENSDE